MQYGGRGDGLAAKLVGALLDPLTGAAAATASQPAAEVIAAKRVAPGTVRFPRVQRGRALAAKRILAIAHELDMGRSNAGAVAAQVVRLKPGWYQAMCTFERVAMRFEHPAAKAEEPVTIAISRAGPFDTAVLIDQQLL